MLSKLSLTNLAALAATAYCSVSKTHCCDDNYDDLTVNGVAPEANTFTAYNGLEYSGFFGTKPISATNGYSPRTSPNVAGAAIQVGAVASGLSLTPFGTIAAGSGTSSFSATSFYFVCVVASGTTLVTKAESCTIAVSGYYTNEKQVPEVTFAFTNTQAINSMYLAKLPNTYVGLKNITIGVADAAVATGGTALGIDEFKHCNHVSGAA